MGDNVTDECFPFQPPLASEYLENLSTDWLVLTSLACVSAFVITIIFAEKVYQLVKHLWKWKHRNHALVIHGLYPVFAVTNAVGLLVPRAERTGDLVGHLYMSLALFAYVELVTDFHGGMDNMKQSLVHTKQIDPRSPPLCCCCRCLPMVKISIRNLTYLHLLIYQFALLKPLLYYIIMVLMDNNRNDFAEDPVYAIVLSYSMSASALVAMWANSMLFKISAGPLKDLNIQIRFACVQAVLITDNIQRTVEDVIMTIAGVSCSEQLDTFAVKLRWHSLIVVFEMLPLAILSRVNIARDKPVFRDVGKPMEKSSDIATVEHTVPTDILNGLRNHTDQVKRENADHRSYSVYL